MDSIKKKNESESQKLWTKYNECTGVRLCALEGICTSAWGSNFATKLQLFFQIYNFADIFFEVFFLSKKTPKAPNAKCQIRVKGWLLYYYIY